MFGLLTAIPGLAGSFLKWLNRRTDVDLEKFKTAVGADTTLNVEELRARVSLAQLLHEQRKADRQSWTTAWMVPATFAVFLIHAAAIVFDSMPLFGHVIGSWRIAELPGKWTEVQQNVILTAFGIGGGLTALTTIKRIFTK